MLRVLSLPPLASMLRPAEAWRLSRVSRRVCVAWRAVGARCPSPRLLGAAQNSSRVWTEARAMRLLQSCQDTPFRTRNKIVRQLLQYLLSPSQLAYVGHETHTPLALRLALRLQRR